MADPVSLSLLALSIGTTVAGTAMAASGARDTGKTQQQIANVEAANLRQQGGSDLAAATVNAQKQTYDTKRLVAKQKADFAASGGGTDGSAAIVMDETAAKGAYNNELEVWQGQEKKRADYAQADVTQAGGVAAAQAGNINADTTILQGAGQAFGTLNTAYGKLPTDPGSGAFVSFDPESGFTTTTTRAAPSYRYGGSSSEERVG